MAESMSDLLNDSAISFLRSNLLMCLQENICLIILSGNRVST